MICLSNRMLFIKYLRSFFKFTQNIKRCGPFFDIVYIRYRIERGEDNEQPGIIDGCFQLYRTKS